MIQASMPVMPTWEVILLHALAALPGFVVGLAALIGVMRNKAKVQEVHLLINSRMDDFKALIAKSSFAEGVKSETDKRRRR